MPEKTDSQQTRLSVVTVFWNSEADVQRWLHALEKVAASVPFAIEVLAIDNASTDGTVRIVENRATTLDIRVIHNDTNRGFAAACNQGLQAARGDWLFLLNPDCEAGAEAVEGMVSFLRHHETVGCVGCMLLHEDGLPQHSHHSEPSAISYWGTHSLISPLCLRVQKFLHRFDRRHAPLETDWLMGACLMTSRSVYQRVGGLDERYFMYSEDVDWCRRIRDAGYHVVHDPRIAIVHHHGTSSRRLPEFAFCRLYRSFLMYTNRHHGRIASASLRWAVILDMTLRIPLHSVRGSRERLDSVRAVRRMFLSNDPESLPVPAP